MKWFVLGVFLAIGAVSASQAFGIGRIVDGHWPDLLLRVAPEGVEGVRELASSGPLTGWTVLADGEPVCTAPYVWPATKEIEC